MILPVFAVGGDVKPGQELPGSWLSALLVAPSGNGQQIACQFVQNLLRGVAIYRSGQTGAG